MDNDVKNNIKQASIWKRGLYMLLLAIFYSLAEVVLFAVIIFQFLLKLVTGEVNQRLLKLGQSLAIYIYQIVQFQNFNSERKPYPFNAWPKSEPQAIKQAEEPEVDTADTKSVAKAADIDDSEHGNKE
jgi:hypothetical protein